MHTPGKQIYEHRILLDDQLVRQANERSGSFTLNTSYFADGAHQLKLLVRTSSGTGSLADKTGAEQLEAYRTWVLITDNAPPTPLQISRVYPSEGTLKIEWNKYERRYAKTIYLYRYDQYGQMVRKTTHAPDAVSGIDVEYLGGAVSYQVGVEDIAGRTAFGQRYPFTAPIPKLLSYRYENTNDLVVTYSAGKFYKNFGKRRYEISGSRTHQYYEATDVNDTIVTFRDLPFGVGFSLYDRTTPANTENRNMFSVSNQVNVPGFGAENTFEPFTFTAYVPALNLFYHRHEQSLKNIDATTLEVKQSKTYNLGAHAISQNGSYMYIFTYTHRELILQLDPVTLEVINTYNIRQMIPGAAYDYINLSVSNTNKLLVKLSRYNATTQTYLLDMGKGEMELTNVNTAMPQLSSISPDGEMLTAGKYLYRRSPSGEWVAKPIPASGTGSIMYHPSRPLYTFLTNGVLRFYSTTNDAEVTSLTLDPGAGLVEMDPATGYVTANDKDYLYIYDIDRNTRLKKIRRVQPVAFYNNRLYASNYYLPLTF